MNYLLGQKVVFNRDSKERTREGGRFSINLETVLHLNASIAHLSLSGVYACFYFASLTLVITAVFTH